MKTGMEVRSVCMRLNKMATTTVSDSQVSCHSLCCLHKVMQCAMVFFTYHSGPQGTFSLAVLRTGEIKTSKTVGRRWSNLGNGCSDQDSSRQQKAGQDVSVVRLLVLSTLGGTREGQKCCTVVPMLLRCTFCLRQCNCKSCSLGLY